MLIRFALPSDLASLRNLFLRSRRTAFFWEACSGFALEDFDLQTVGEMQLLAFDGDRLLGFISVWEPDNFVHHLHVHPDAVNRGVGRKLLHALPGWSTTPYQLKCVAENTNALAFYRANNFVQTGRGRAKDQDYFLLAFDCDSTECGHRNRNQEVAQSIMTGSARG
ncbi:GNAT family N-acetyltransferase [Acidovorax sp. ACV02]|uniref:GNAT family N-acetyltransferase n=1 Tax=Acidovorax sp. ACV02 TaxID=2769310 RepID=UPI001CE0EC36|nr:GNAT family N-acetyltransferase [Acidovorax sp. ACV02]